MAFKIKTRNPEKTYAIGRNGIWDVQGIEVLECDGNESVSLTPVGKRGVLNAGFKIANSDMDEICVRWLRSRGVNTIEKSENVSTMGNLFIPKTPKSS